MAIISNKKYKRNISLRRILVKKTIAVIIISIITILFLLGFIDRSPNQVINNESDVIYSINNIETTSS